MGNFKLNSKNNFIIIILFFCGKIFSQDTISFKNGLQQAVKVSEVGSNEIKYQRWDNLTGPIYVTDKNEINSIKYSNGVTERYDLKDPKLNVVLPSQNQNQQNQNQQNENQNNQNPLNRLEFLGGKQLMFQQRIIIDIELMGLISNHPNQTIRSNLQNEYKKMMNYKRAAPGFLALGFGIGFAVPIVVTAVTLFGGGFGISGLTNAVTIIVAGALTGGVIRTLGCAFSKMNKNKMMNQRKVIAEMYNNGL